MRRDRAALAASMRKFPKRFWYLVRRPNRPQAQQIRLQRVMELRISPESLTSLPMVDVEAECLS